MRYHTKMKAILLTVAMLGTISAVAQENDVVKNKKSINSYAKVVTWSGVTNQSSEVTNGEATVKIKNSLSSKSRFGFKLNQENLFINIEAGVKGSDNSNTISLRHAYAKYKINNGSIIVGQTYTPYKGSLDILANGDFGDYATGYDSRQMQLRLTMYDGYFALMSNKQTDETTPKLALGYRSNIAKGVNLNLGAVYQKGNTADDTAWMTYLRLKSKYSGFYNSLNISYGVNTKDMGMKYNIKTGISGKDSTIINFSTLLGYKVSKLVKTEIGISYQRGNSGIDGENSDTDLQLFANLPIKLTKGFTVSPAILYKNHLKDSSDAIQGTELYYGLLFVGKI